MKWLAFLLSVFCCAAQEDVALVGNAFHPREIAGIHVMWDASTIQGSLGDTITNWPTSVGFYTASNGITSKAPLLQRTQYGNRNALEFDGVDDWLASEPVSLNTRITYFGVVKLPASTNSVWFFEHSANANANPGMFFVADTWLIFRDGSIQYGPSGAPSINYYGTNLVIGSYSYNGAGSIYSNGFFRSSSVQAGGARTESFVTQKIFFASRAGTAFLDGKKQNAEHIFYTNVLSSFDRRKVHEYIQNKYAIPSVYRGL